MLPDWEGCRQDLRGRIGDMGRLTTWAVRGYRELTGARNRTARLEAKIRELVARDGCAD